MRKGIFGVILANLSWVFGLIVFAALLLLGHWRLGILAGLLTFVLLLAIGLKMTWKVGRKFFDDFGSGF